MNFIIPSNWLFGSRSIWAWAKHAPQSAFFIPLSTVEARCKDIPSYVDFFKLFVSNVVGKKHFENVCWREKLFNFVTVSDEAIALLIYEDNHERWTDIGKKANCNFSTIQPKHTSGGNACQMPKVVKISSLSKKGKN